MNFALLVSELLSSYRYRAGLTQKSAASLANVGVKTLSSFETSARTSSMKVTQLTALLKVYGVSLATFEEDLAELRHSERERRRAAA